MAAMGLEAELQPVDGDRVNAIGIWRGTGGGKSLFFNGHLDTNPVGEGWTVDPCGGLIDDDFIYGIGVSNMAAFVFHIELEGITRHLSKREEAVDARLRSRQGLAHRDRAQYRLPADRHHHPPGFYGTDAGLLYVESGMEGVVCGPGRRYNTMPDERVDIPDYLDMIRIYLLTMCDIFETCEVRDTI